MRGPGAIALSPADERVDSSAAPPQRVEAERHGHAAERTTMIVSEAPKTGAAVGRATGYYRWVVCGLLFLATTINYIDRQVIGILKPTLQAEFRWSEVDYAD